MDLKDRSHHIIQDRRFSDHLINFINRRFSVFLVLEECNYGGSGGLSRNAGICNIGVLDSSSHVIHDLVSSGSSPD